MDDYLSSSFRNSMIIEPPLISIVDPGFPISVIGLSITKFSNSIYSSGSSINSPFLD